MDYDQIFQDAFKKHKEKRYSEAEILYRQIVEAIPRHLHANYLLGVLYLDIKNLDKAERQLKIAIRLRPHIDKPVYALSKVYELMERPNMAQTLLQRFHEIRSSSARVLVFGDSHSEDCFSGISWCRSHLVGFYTMHRVGRDGLGALDIAQYGASSDSTVVFIFGEPDVRLHIGRQRDLLKRAVDEIVTNLVHGYFETIRINVERYPGIRTIVSSVVPPCDIHPDDVFPKYGVIDDRVFFAQMLNDALRSACEATGYGFLDLHSLFAQEDGSMNPLFTSDHVHVGRQFHPIVACALSALIERMEGSLAPHGPRTS